MKAFGTMANGNSMLSKCGFSFRNIIIITGILLVVSIYLIIGVTISMRISVSRLQPDKHLLIRFAFRFNDIFCCVNVQMHICVHCVRCNCLQLTVPLYFYFTSFIELNTIKPWLITSVVFKPLLPSTG